MKRIVSILLILTSLFSVCSAKPKKNSKKAPLWTSDEGRFQVFPKDEYLSALSFGSSEQEAKAKAANTISNQIRTQVESEITSTYTGKESEGYVKNRKQISQNITVSGDNALFQLEYTTPFYSDDMGMFVCVAFINRQAAWDYVKPKLESISENFTKAYNQALLMEDNFKKVSSINIACLPLNDFYQYYNFALVVNKNAAELFKDTDTLAYEAYLLGKQLSKECVLKINLEGDKNRRVYSKLSEILTQKGFLIGNNNNYELNGIITAEPIDNGDVWSCYPSINIEITGKNGVINSYSKQFDKIAGFEKDSCERKVYKEIENTLAKEFLLEK